MSTNCTEIPTTSVQLPLRPQTGHLWLCTDLTNNTKNWSVCSSKSSPCFWSLCKCSVWWCLYGLIVRYLTYLYYSQWRNVTEYIDSSPVLSYIFEAQFTLHYTLPTFIATVYFHSTIFWRQILYLLLHYIYLITLVTSYFGDCCIRAKESCFLSN